MGRKNCNARKIERPKRIKAQPNFYSMVVIPKRSFKRQDDDYGCGLVVTEGEVVRGA